MNIPRKTQKAPMTPQGSRSSMLDIIIEQPKLNTTNKVYKSAAMKGSAKTIANAPGKRRSMENSIPSIT